MIPAVGGEGSAQPGPRKRRGKKPKRGLAPVELIVTGDGTFAPADGYYRRVCRERKYKTGDILLADLKQQRSVGFNKLVHKFGQLCKDNIERFASCVDAHAVLKVVQLEADIGCDRLLIMVPGLGLTEYRIPQSLSFDSMEETYFRAIYRRMSEHVSKKYWPTISPEAIEELAEVMPDDPT